MNKTINTKKLNLIVMIKDEEKGLLSISGNRSKSMLPILGDAKILDLYLYPVRLNKFGKIYVDIKSESIDIKDYINYYYKDYSVIPLIGDNLINQVIKILKKEKNPTLILQADGFIFCNWDALINEVAEFKNDNRIITYNNDDNIFEALYIGDSGNINDILKKEKEIKLAGNLTYNDLWEGLLTIAKNNYDESKLKSINAYYNLQTVREYYDFHIDLLDDMEKCYKYTSLFPEETLKEKDEINIQTNGIVKDSYISSSSYIEGKVEKSFIFSNVKISKGSYIHKSVVMNNNSIAENAILEKVILCDSGELFQSILPAVNEGAVLGEKTDNGYNNDFPDFIYGGISLIGSGVEIPKGFIISANCYIKSNTGKLILKEIKKLETGKSIPG